MNGVDKALWGRLSPLLDEFLDLPESERAGRLSELRAESPELAEALAEMLGKLPSIESGGFLESPAMPRPGGLAGQQVGAYTLARELGHGGMGTVWLAHRTDGRYQGQVAIKFLRAGLLGAGDAGRFAREGSILARLSHPHIARLLDAGVAGDAGQPYLVLEFIDGEPIDAYCERQHLPTAARLALFLDVLSAVSHAHNRLILHRDLKPSNILVTAAGEVKLLDFGIAKLLDEASAGGATELTAVVGNAFTPEFAAPEQVQGGDVTTATDVYALGVLLYLLLSGAHPTLAPTEAPLDRMRAVIEIEPRRLSESALRRGGAARSAPGRRLAAEFRGDLDTILAKALKKSPAERYANAAALADDLRRYLAHKPIAARPDTRLYRLARFVRRNRTAVGATALVVTALALGAALALWQAREAGRQREQAEGLIEFMLGDLKKNLQPAGQLDVLGTVGDRALAYYAAQDIDHLDAESLSRRARALTLIGDIAEQRGHLDEAQRRFQEAADTTAKLLARAPDDGRRVYDHAQSEFYLGVQQWRMGRLSEAEGAFQRYLTMAERLHRLDPSNVDWEAEQYFAQANISAVLLDLGRPVEVVQRLTPAVDALIRLAQTRQPDLLVPTAHGLGWLARAYGDEGQYDEAIATDRRKIALAESAPGGQRNMQARYVISNGYGEIGRWQVALGRAAEGVAAVRSSLEQERALVERDVQNFEWKGELAGSHLFLAMTALDQDDRATARAEFAQLQKPLAELLARPWPQRSWRLSLRGGTATVRARLAETPAEMQAALAELGSFLADVQRFRGEGAMPTVEESAQIARAELVQGDLLERLGRAADARAAWASATVDARPGAHTHYAYSTFVLAFADLRLGQRADARTLVDGLAAAGYRPPAIGELLAALDERPAPPGFAAAN